MNFCYNCSSTDHFSRNCPEAQKVTRCYSCGRVCDNERSHYKYCSNKSFVSRPIPNTDVARFSTLVGDLKLITNADLYVMNGPQPIKLEGDFPPVQINTNHGFLCGQQKALKYYQWNPAMNRECRMRILNADDDSIQIFHFLDRLLQFFHFLIYNKKTLMSFQKKLILGKNRNGEIEVQRDGSVTYLQANSSVLNKLN